MKIGLIKEGKIPHDYRVPFTPLQCKFLRENKNIEVIVEPSAIRCFSDDDYRACGVEVSSYLKDCDYLFGVKEVLVEDLIPNMNYFFFSHTRKEQPHNQKLFRAILDKRITLIDYENLEHSDGRRILGFGFFAGVVGTHNGILAYGRRTKKFSLERIYERYNFEELSGSYFGLKLPNLRVVFTGSGRVAHGVLEVLNLMGMHEVEPDKYLYNKFPYPVYTNLMGSTLYRNRKDGGYSREEYHQFPERYHCLFENYTDRTDILINGIFWTNHAPRLFEMEDLRNPSFSIQTISDITDDKFGSVPCNFGDVPIKEMGYGVDRMTGKRTPLHQSGGVDVLAVGNLPNELPKDASRYFGEQLIKYVVDDLAKGSEILDGATMTKAGKITPRFSYMKTYAKKKE